VIRPSNVLADIDEAVLYFEERSDVLDGDYGQPAPNEAMTMEVSLREARAAVAELVEAARVVERFAVRHYDDAMYDRLFAALAAFGDAA
jgi:hypothetical protein